MQAVFLGSAREFAVVGDPASGTCTKSHPRVDLVKVVAGTVPVIDEGKFAAWLLSSSGIGAENLIDRIPPLLVQQTA